MSKSVIMLGSHVSSQGGIVSVVKEIKNGGLFDLFKMEYISTHMDGRKHQKIGIAISAWSTLMARLLIKKASLVHIHVSARASFWRKFLFVLPIYAFRIPFVLHLHGSEFREFYEQESSRIARKLISFVFTRACTVIVLSNSWADWVGSTFPKATIKVVYNPAPCPTDNHIKTKRDDASILFLGRLGNRKGTYDLVKAVSLLVKEFPEIKLLLGGDGDLDEITALAESYGISDNVRILGWVRGNEKHELLNQSTLYALPSYNEGLPMGMLEAMAAGLPILSTNVGGIPEALDDGVDGFLIEPGDINALVDSIKTILTDIDLQRRMGEMAKHKANNKFSLDKFIEQIGKIYNDCGVKHEPR